MKSIKLNKKHENIPLRELLCEEGIYLQADCGGNGTCGKCKVRFMTGAPEPTIAERERFSKEELEAGWRLGCKSVVPGTGGHGTDGKGTVIEVELEEEQSVDEVKKEKNQSVMETEPGENYFNIEETESLCDRIDRKTKVALDIGTTTIVAAAIDPVTGDTGKQVTIMNHQKIYGSDVISRIHAVNRGYGEELRAMVTKDIEELIRRLGEDCHFNQDIQDKPDKQLKSESPLEIYISCNTTMGHILQGYSCEGLGRAPYTPVNLDYHEYLCKSVNISEENVDKDAGVGHGTVQNYVMHILPGISAFVGADIVSGLVACGMDQSEKINLLVDIGTNGEMAIGNKDGFLVTSAAAGPAFEGGNISCGMPGIPGAISRVNIDRIENEQSEKMEVRTSEPVTRVVIKENSVTSSLTIEENCETIEKKNKTLCKQIYTIGDECPRGICGSGVLELVYELKKKGLIAETGLLMKEFFQKGFPVYESNLDVRTVSGGTNLDVRAVQGGGNLDVRTVSGGTNLESDATLCKDIFFTQKDIREVQQAKAAIRTGMELLIKEYGTDYDRIDKVYLAGSFGQHLNVQKAAGIGLIPEELQDKVVAVGNTSLAGAVMAAREEQVIQRFQRVIDISAELILADHKEFQELYLTHMYLN